MMGDMGVGARSLGLRSRVRERRRHAVSVFIAAAVMASAMAAHGDPAPAAQTPDPPVRKISFLTRLGAEYGGDYFAEIRRPDGKVSKLVDGGIVAYTAGLLYRPVSPFALEMTLGWKLEASRYDNGDVEFDRFPLDVIAAWSTGGFRLGLGVTLHLAPNISCHVNSDVGDRNRNFKRPFFVKR